MAISDLKLPQGVSAHEFKSPVLLAEGLALNVAKQLSEAIDTQGNATLVVSGGRSPVAFFQHLAKQALDWSSVVVSLADERWVPVEHADSNAGSAQEISAARPGGQGAVSEPLQRQRQSRTGGRTGRPFALRTAGDRRAGTGHGRRRSHRVAVPQQPEPADALQADGSRRCYPMLAPTVPRQRLTMSRALLASAKHKVLSISGQSKLTTLSTALAGDDVAAMPIRAFLQPTLEIYWCP
jgi:6-phosphogluconolactonase